MVICAHCRNNSWNYGYWTHTAKVVTMIKLLFKEFKSGMHQFGQNITLIVNSILLTIVYILGVGITSITAKVLSKQFMKKSLSKKSKTYWSKLDLKKEKEDTYYRQF